MRYIISLSLAFLLFVAFRSVSHEPVSLVWTPESKLEWSDFMATPDAGSTLAAELMCGIETEMITEISGIGHGTIEFTARAVAYPMESWHKTETDYLLAHEQLHFDIAEVYARKLRKKVSESSFKNGRTGPKLTKITQEIMDAYNKRQRDYDHETRHSLEKDQQLKWAAAIAVELEALSDFEAHDVSARISP